MGSPKTNVRWGAMAKVEAAYGTPETLSAATDGVDLIEEPEVDPQYVHDGARHGKSPASHGGRKRVGRMARFAEPTLRMEPAGAGAAYAAGVTPNVHTFLRAAGLAGAVDTTPASEKWTYTPHAVGAEESITLELYSRGEKHPLAGVYMDLTIDMDVPGIPIFEFGAHGLYSALPTDVAFPSITYPTVEPPKAEGVNFEVTIGVDTFTAGKIKKLMVPWNRNIAPRALDNVTGLHGGFNVGAERIIECEAIIEAEALTVASPYLATAGLNIFELMERASVMALAFQCGSVQYKRFSFAAATAQMIAAPRQLEGSAAMWAVKFHCLPSTLTTNDEMSLVFD
jgi:hypothetical protein